MGLRTAALARWLGRWAFQTRFQQWGRVGERAAGAAPLDGDGVMRRLSRLLLFCCRGSVSGLSSALANLWAMQELRVEPPSRGQVNPRGVPAEGPATAATHPNRLARGGPEGGRPASAAIACLPIGTGRHRGAQSAHSLCVGGGTCTEAAGIRGGLHQWRRVGRRAESWRSK